MTENGARQVWHRGRSYGVPFDVLDQSPEWRPHWRRGEVGGEPNSSVDLWYADEQPIREKFWLPKTGDVVVDVGCSMGNWTLPALIWGAHVYAVDPREGSLALINAISDANQIDPSQLTLIHRALGEDGGYPPDLQEAIRTYPGGFHPPADAVFTTLDKLVADYQISQVDWVKIDVEGCELSVIRGGLEIFRTLRPIVIVEDHTGLAPFPFVGQMRIRDQWQDLLRDLGYEMTPELYTGSPGDIDRYFWSCSPHG